MGVQLLLFKLFNFPFKDNPINLEYLYIVKKVNIDPLLDMYLDQPKVKNFKFKNKVRDVFKEALDAEQKRKQQVANSTQQLRAQGSTEAYHRLTNQLNLRKVLVGSYNTKPFYALVDTNHRICLPCFDNVEQ